MNAELVINATQNGVDIALLQDKALVELHREHTNQQYAVGDIYLGRVRKLIPHLNAAFVDVGYEKDAFLHYLDLGPQFSSLNNFTLRTISGEQKSADLINFQMSPDIRKEGKIKDVLGLSNVIPVQVAKEPISQKGPRLTSELTLAGRYLVLVPFSNKVSLSSRITDEPERDRLRKLMHSIRPSNMGVIIRTQAEGTKVAELDQDLQELVKRWEEMYKNMRTARAPQRILGEIDKTSSVLRDLLTEDFTSIHVNDEKVASIVRDYLKSISPSQENIIKLHKTPDLFDLFNIHRQIKASFGKQVNLKSGAYLIVEHTEAMHVIDVNSGNRKNASVKDQEENALQTNVECAKEIARLLRLRDMGGIICIDFIDMQNRENQRQLHEALREHMKQDKAKHNVLPPSKFGVVEITRERVKPVTKVVTTEKCPSCDGKGKVEAPVLFTDELENSVRFLAEEGRYKHIRIVVHPMVEAYLKKGYFNNILKSWRKRHKIKIQVEASSSNEFLEYHFFDTEGEEINL
ncbi:MAG: Rne/Rng family ribonuclease [Crocinitomicaceae bacterium]|nr:Rne/Rng family ribonuclease [Crocinitomicaceae bacterium]